MIWNWVYQDNNIIWCSSCYSSYLVKIFFNIFSTVYNRELLFQLRIRSKSILCCHYQLQFRKLNLPQLNSLISLGYRLFKLFCGWKQCKTYTFHMAGFCVCSVHLHTHARVRILSWLWTISLYYSSLSKSTNYSLVKNTKTLRRRWQLCIRIYLCNCEFACCHFSPFADI